MDRQRRWPLHQINVITALIRQPFNLKGAWTEGERERQAEGKRGRQQRQEGRKKKRALVAFRCANPPPHTHTHTHTHTPPLISSSSLSLTLMSSPAIVCPGLFKSNTPPEEIPGDRRGPVLSHTAKAAPPEHPRAKRVDGLTCPSLSSCLCGTETAASVALDKKN